MCIPGLELSLGERLRVDKEELHAMRTRWDSRLCNVCYPFILIFYCNRLNSVKLASILLIFMEDLLRLYKIQIEHDLLSFKVEGWLCMMINLLIT